MEKVAKQITTLRPRRGDMKGNGMPPMILVQILKVISGPDYNSAILRRILSSILSVVISREV